MEVELIDLAASLHADLPEGHDVHGRIGSILGCAFMASLAVPSQTDVLVECAETPFLATRNRRLPSQ
jgi:hypothetical protein